MSAVATLPTARAVDAAWHRYADLMRAAVDTPALLADRHHCEQLAIAWDEWRDLFLAGRAK
jgi:hypothetical protein